MRAIDVHVHVPEPPGDPAAEERKRMAGYFRAAKLPKTPDEMYETYKAQDMMAVIFAIDAESRSGDRYVGNDYVASVVAKYPGQFIGFASVDPWKGAMAVRELERAVTELGLRGLKMMQITQAFFPNDERFYPLWEKCSALGVPVLFHTGQTGVGAGSPGGAGLKLKYAQPLLIDDVAADFPDLKIIMAHPAVPWQEEQLSVALHKANVYIDLSGWSPKYFRPILVQYASTLLQDKVLFGSDYPAIQPDRWLKDFEALGLKEEVQQKILLENARKLLGIE
ncbi:MAG TPA: amidohydrolase family protein [Blastocatellia bacterium]|nr:amidohydrolase family protein [Blastocatellia bacterium]